MKKRLLPILLLLLLGSVAQAQLAPGSIAPDFTATDIDGNTYNLYDLLDQGKTVYIDFSATWCGPCWNYHNTHALRDIWELYGPPGTDEAFVFFIESDAATNTACLYGPAGCIGGTQGDWVTGTPYPIVDDAGIGPSYAVAYYPTIYMVCPADKKVYETGQLPAGGLWAMRNSTCPPLAVLTQLNSVTNVQCFGGSDGSIDITASGGTAPYTYSWSNGATTEDLYNVPAGTYYVTITSNNGWTGVSDPITVIGPNSPVDGYVVETTEVGCNGILGSITVAGTGGWPGSYQYLWTNGQAGETAYSLQSGNHTVSITDSEGCTTTISHYLPPAVLPSASIAPADQISCFQTTVQLDATGSSSGPEIGFQWFASGGGNILSGATTATPTVNAAGNYTVQVSNTNNGCSAFASVMVTQNIVLPTVEAGPTQTISCDDPEVELAGSGDSGSDITYAWTATNGGNIVSGGNTQHPTVDANGTYIFTITNSSNGCSNTDTTYVDGTNLAPEVEFESEVLTCILTSTEITTTGSSSDLTFAWEGPNGFTSTEQNPTVAEAGEYTLVAVDTMTNCSVESAYTVTADLEAPGASATGGAIDCTTTEVEISGSSPDMTAEFAWEGPNGFTSTEQNPTVSEDGEYILTVTAGDNGCTSTATAVVADNSVLPAAVAEAPGNLNCNTVQLELDGTGSAQGNDIEYNWSTADGNIVSGGTSLTPIIDAAGEYVIEVTNTATGCVNTASVTVSTTPGVTAEGVVDTQVSCNGLENGSATVNAGGGDEDYNYAWSNGQTTQSVTGLSAGTYQVVVTDGEGCTAGATIIINEPAELVANASATAQTMNGVDDGTATANPQGGTADYTYTWSNGGTTQTITDLAPGTYTVVVTDLNGCTDQQTVTVNSFDCALSASISGQNITCFGDANGSATVSLVGAEDPITYAWSNGETTQNISGLAPGTYTVDIVDANNCPATLSVNITQPLLLDPNTSVTHETEFGANDGTATANTVGGVGPYTYDWNTGETTQTITGLAPGTYTVIVTDSNGCSSTESVNVNAFSCAISASIGTTDVSCFGQTNGTAAVTLQGGTSPFTYSWSNGATTSNINNLAAGVYTVSVIDSDGCETTQNTTISEPDALVAAIDNVEDVVCPTDNNGSITTQTEGGVDPYTYLWNTGSTASDLTGVGAGDYSVVITDANGCSSTLEASIASTDTDVPVVAVQNTTLALGADGTVALNQSTLDVLATDNCAVASVTIEPAVLDCERVGINSVTVVVIDNSGNSTELVVDVEVVDNLAPVVTCPDNIVICPSENPVAYAAPVAVDNCLSSGGNWDLTAGLPSGSDFPTGITTQTYTYTDANGNEGTCSFTVEVTPPAEIVVVSVTNDQDSQGIGAINISVAGEGPFTYEWTLNGELVSTEEDPSNLNAGDYVVLVTDANGCSFTIDAVTVGNTSATQEPAWLQGVQLRPNPAFDEVQIVFSELLNIDLEVSLIDATGRTITREYSKGLQTVTLNVSSLPEGMYLVKISSGNAVGMRKLIVGH